MRFDHFSFGTIRIDAVRWADRGDPTVLDQEARALLQPARTSVRQAGVADQQPRHPARARGAPVGGRLFSRASVTLAAIRPL